MPVLRFLTIGQSPRPDVVGEVLSFAGPRARALPRVESGVLDGLTPGEIDAAAPAPSGPVLASRLRNGSEVLLSARFVHDRMARLLADLPPGDIAVLLCTGRGFDATAAACPAVEASRAVDESLERAIAGQTSAVRIGFLVPHPDQLADAVRRSPPGTDARAAAASPYAEEDRIAEAVREALGDANDDPPGRGLVVLDCLGYSVEHANAARTATGARVLLAREALGEALERVVARATAHATGRSIGRAPEVEAAGADRMGDPNGDSKDPASPVSSPTSTQGAA